jgi:Transposase IS116/IS110/IS902 family
MHAVLLRNLNGRPPMTDPFGKRGRAWLDGLELPCLRQLDVLAGEVGILEKQIAQHALGSKDIRRLMTVPGVSLTTAATFIAAVGEIDRFRSPRKLVSYLGLDPQVRQSGSERARHGRISKQGGAQARQMLTEAAFVAVGPAGPMRAFYERVRARPGSQIAVVAVARKLAVLLATPVATPIGASAGPVPGRLLLAQGKEVSCPALPRTAGLARAVCRCHSYRERRPHRYRRPLDRLDDRDLAQVAVAIVLSKGSAVADARV